MRIINPKKILLLIAAGSCSIISSAQNDMGIYFLRLLPQSSFLNPAHQIPCKVFVGIPALSSIHAGYDNSLFTYNDVIISTSTDSIIPNYNFFLNHSRNGKIEFIRTELELSLLHFGFKLKKQYYLSFFIRDRLDAGILYPINLVRLPLTGNTPYIGETYRMDNLRLFGVYFREWALGLSKTINPRVTVGARVQLLFGKANIHTSKNQLFLYTNPDIYQLQANSSFIGYASPLIVTIDTANHLQNVEIPSMSITSFLLNSKNKGLAFSAGVTYQYSDDIILEASLLDIGAIMWRYVPVRVKENANFLYSGFYYNPTTGQFDNVQQVIDSALQSYTLSAQQKNYFTALTPKFYIGGTYQMNSWFQGGILLRGEWYHQRLYLAVSPSIIASYKFLSASFNWTVVHRNMLNPGISLNLQSRRFGFYAAADNLYGLFKYKSMQFANIRFGFNLLWGCPKNRIKTETLCPAYDEIAQKREKIEKLKRK